MDWFSLLLIVLFVILPIIQQVLEQARKGRAGQEADTEEPDTEYLEARRPAGARREVEAPSADNGWSGDWAPWPGTEAEERETVREPVVRVPVPVEQPRRELREDVRSLERIAERTAAPVAVPARRAATTVPTVQQRAPRQRPRTGHGIVRTGLRSPAELRRSIVLIEVLGPPVSLRQPAGGQTNEIGLHN